MANRGDTLPIVLDYTINGTPIEEWDLDEIEFTLGSRQFLLSKGDITQDPTTGKYQLVTVPAFVPIVPLVDPLFAIEPLTEPLPSYAVLPVSRSPAAKFAPDVSKNFAVPPPLFGMSTSGTFWYVTPLIMTFCAIFGLL